MSSATTTVPVTATPGAEVTPALAVIYLRVSTREQAERGGTEEGFSIPAQREATHRKADELRAEVVKEFVDAGESARSADRNELQAMLAYIEAHQVRYVIVHKVDRLARNRVDDVAIHQALLTAGTTLISATESIDETPSGMLLHGIMSSIAEFYSRNLATEVTKGLTQKVAQGGTPGKAPVGYRNIRFIDTNGREIRTVEVDPERARLVRLAFEMYATGDYSVIDVLNEITLRGLTTLETPKRPSKPLGRNTMYKLLTNPYYAGIIRYRGALHPGSHEPIVEPVLFDKVQALLSAKTVDDTRHREHTHHLKGMLYCGACGSRMLLDFATNRHGSTYAYFVCGGRASRRTTCTRRAVPVPLAEQLVAETYKSLTIGERNYLTASAKMRAAFDIRAAGPNQELGDLAASRARLKSESDKLIKMHFADAIDLPTLKEHQDRIRAGLADIDRRLAEHDEHDQGARAFLDSSLRLLTDAHRSYAGSNDHQRRLANQAFYSRITITEDEQITTTLAEPFASITFLLDQNEELP
ncbi:MAG: recombinase family protein, partial [Propionibacteriaceae bacterium]|nr:recombinase family protein [Propionibacteriaceae bacterium]